jgi:hypothetical protein
LNEASLDRKSDLRTLRQACFMHCSSPLSFHWKELPRIPPTTFFRQQQSSVMERILCIDITKYNRENFGK